jgi:BirA family biotin operon repressor/biotin-[acetyl-CoA-carboxylase] ligase
VVLGIGANVDPEGELPEGATSLSREIGRTVAVEAVCAAILGRIRVWYHALASGRAEDLRAGWRQRSVPWWGREVVAGQGETAVVGLARDIDEDGALVLERPGGRFVRVRAGDVAQVRLEPSADPEGRRG